MYKVVFGWLKRGGVPEGAELNALYQLMLPIFKMMKVRRPPVKGGIDDRLLKIYIPMYEYWALHTSRPGSFLKSLDRSFPEARALRALREDVKRLLAELYPPQKKKEKTSAKVKSKK